MSQSKNLRKQQSLSIITNQNYHKRTLSNLLMCSPQEMDSKDSLKRANLSLRQFKIAEVVSRKPTKGIFETTAKPSSTLLFNESTTDNNFIDSINNKSSFQNNLNTPTNDVLGLILPNKPILSTPQSTKVVPQTSNRLPSKNKSLSHGKLTK